MATTMYAELSMYGENLDPDEITALVGIQPNVTGRKGDHKGPPGGPARRTEGCWKLVTDRSYECEATLDDHINMLLERIRAVEDVVCMLAARFHLEIACVLHLDDCVPVLHIDADMLKKLALMNARIDIDGYLFGENRQHGDAS